MVAMGTGQLLPCSASQISLSARKRGLSAARFSYCFFFKRSQKSGFEVVRNHCVGQTPQSPGHGRCQCLPSWLQTENTAISPPRFWHVSGAVRLGGAVLAGHAACSCLSACSCRRSGGGWECQHRMEMAGQLSCRWAGGGGHAGAWVLSHRGGLCRGQTGDTSGTVSPSSSPKNTGTRSARWQ